MDHVGTWLTPLGLLCWVGGAITILGAMASAIVVAVIAMRHPAPRLRRAAAASAVIQVALLVLAPAIAWISAQSTLTRFAAESMAGLFLTMAIPALAVLAFVVAVANTAALIMLRSA